MSTSRDRLLLVLVGLPARGKSYVANKVTTYLQWRGIPCHSFNVGASRRKVATAQPQTADFFSAANATAAAMREAVALEVLHTALAWLDEGGGSVAILDATNTTRSRRAKVLATVAERYPTPSAAPHVVFVESICNDPAVLRSNMLQKVTNSPDYAGMPVEAALADLRRRVAEYERVYETLDETVEDGTSPLGPISYIQTVDLASKVICRNIFGPTAFAIVSLLMAIHIGARPIYLVRAGQCTDDVVRAMLRDNAARASGGSGQRGAVTSRPTSPTILRIAAGSSEDAAGHDTGRSGFAVGPPTHPTHSRNPSFPTASSPPYPSAAQPTATAISAGLTLNANGQAFANQMCKFILRRTAGGDVSPKMLFPLPSDGGGSGGGMPSLPGSSSSVHARVVDTPTPDAPAAHGATPSLTQGGGAGGDSAVSPAVKPPGPGLSLSGGGDGGGSDGATKPPPPLRPVAHHTTTAQSGAWTDGSGRVAGSGDDDGGMAQRDTTMVSDVPAGEGQPSHLFDPRIHAHPAIPGSKASAGSGDTGSLGASTQARAPPTTTTRPSMGHHARITSSRLVTHISNRDPVRPMRVALSGGDGLEVGPGGGRAPLAAPAPAPAAVHATAPLAITAVGAVAAGVDDGSSVITPKPDVATGLIRRVRVSRTPKLGPMTMGAEVHGPHRPAPSAGATTTSTTSSSLLACDDAFSLDHASNHAPSPLSSVAGVMDVECAGGGGEEEMAADEDALDGIVASTPIMAQNEHYKRGEGGGSSRDGMSDLVIFDDPPAVYTSTLPRTIQMVEPLPFPSQALSALNPMETGICMGIPLQYLKDQFPDEYTRWRAAPDRARHRITGGESLMDVVERLSPFVIEMERQRRPVVIVSHLSTLQVLLAYFKGVPLADCISIDCPMNTVMEFTPHQYGWMERRHKFTQVATADPSARKYVVW